MIFSIKNTINIDDISIITLTLCFLCNYSNQFVNILKDKQLFVTADGSHSLYLPNLDETYHSKHGAIQETYHVFIKNGLEAIDKENISILEIGLGTGLNCFITFLETQNKKTNINYTGIEAFPISLAESKLLNYVIQLKATAYQSVFDNIHLSEWEKTIQLSKKFTFLKKQIKIQDIADRNVYDLIYFDAFGPRIQPELWTENIFLKMYHALKPEGILITYSAKGSVRRAMQKIGFRVEKLPGPPGKREMLRGTKLDI